MFFPVFESLKSDVDRNATLLPTGKADRNELMHSPGIQFIGTLVLLSAGCGDWSAQNSRIEPSRPMTVSVTNPDFEELPPDGSSSLTPDIDAHSVSASNDEATDLLQKIQRLRQRPLPQGQEAAQEARREINRKIIGHATKVIVLTVDREDRKEQFSKAISELLESRFQIAQAGTDDDMDRLYADVELLNERDPTSAEAAEGVYYLARFAHSRARRNDADETVWVTNFARWAQEFALRFPGQRDRAAALLFGAGRSCEMHALAVGDVSSSETLMAEAIRCYERLTENFGRTKEGLEANAVLRRLRLPGQRLSQFAGPTLAGDFVSADDLLGRVAIIYFWSPGNDEFNEHLLPLLKQADEASNNQLWIVGISLDSDASRVQAFVNSKRVPGRQIFFRDGRQQGWENPLIKFWGISRIPSVWLVDRHGVVQQVDIRSGELVDSTRRLFQ